MSCLQLSSPLPRAGGTPLPGPAYLRSQLGPAADAAFWHLAQPVLPNQTQRERLRAPAARHGQPPQSLCRRVLSKTASALIHERVMVAQRLLSHSTLSVAQVGYELGFESASYLRALLPQVHQHHARGIPTALICPVRRLQMGCAGVGGCSVILGCKYGRCHTRLLAHGRGPLFPVQLLLPYASLPYPDYG